jgi:hypothetical protein
MRFLIASLLSCFLLAALPAVAGVPHEEERASEAERIQEELRARREASRRDAARREAARREVYREDDDYDRRYARRDAFPARVWLGVGAGVAYAPVDTACSPSFGPDCSESGLLDTYSGNLTFSGSDGLTLRLRGVRAADAGGAARTPYETAVMVGSRLGYSDWYGLLGVGALHHLDDAVVDGDDSTTGLAWEIVYAPPAHGPLGLELGLQGNAADRADYVGFNVGIRFGSLR